MTLNPPNRGQYVGPLDAATPQAGSPEDMQFLRDSMKRAYERQTVRANRKPVKFRTVSGMELPVQTIKTVRAPGSGGHHFDYTVDDETGMALPLTAVHADDCPTCKDESYGGSWYKEERP